MERREGRGEEGRGEDRNTAAVCNTMIIDQVTNERREKEREKMQLHLKGVADFFPMMLSSVLLSQTFCAV